MNSTLVGLFNDYKKLSKITTFKCLYGLTLEVDGYTGPLIEIYVSDTASYYDINPLPNGKIDKQQIISLSGGGNVYVSIIYDQYDFSDAEQSVIANMPKIYDEDDGLIEENGEPAILFDNIDDYMEVSTMPYSASEPVISMLAMYTRDTTGDVDMIIGSQPENKGILFYNNVDNKTTLRTRRTATTTLQADDAIISGTSVIAAAIANRTDLKIYENGELVKSGSDTDTDFDMPTKVTIGAWGTGALPSGSKIQLIAISLNDESNNMEALYNELHSRYDSTIPNPRTYFSDKPELLSSGDYANGRLVGDIRYSEHAKIFAWASRPQGGYGAIDIVNIDDQYNNLVTDPFTNFEIFQRINDIDSIDKEVKRLNDLKRVRSNRINALKDYLSSNMEAMQIDEIECDLFSITLKKAGAGSVVIDDESKLQKEYIVTKSTPNKVLIKQDINKGLTVTGAHIEPGKRALLIK